MVNGLFLWTLKDTCGNRTTNRLLRGRPTPALSPHSCYQLPSLTENPLFYPEQIGFISDGRWGHWSTWGGLPCVVLEHRGAGRSRHHTRAAPWPWSQAHGRQQQAAVNTTGLKECKHQAAASAVDRRPAGSVASCCQIPRPPSVCLGRNDYLSEQVLACPESVSVCLRRSLRFLLLADRLEPHVLPSRCRPSASEPDVWCILRRLSGGSLSRSIVSLSASPSVASLFWPLLSTSYYRPRPGSSVDVFLIVLSKLERLLWFKAPPSFRDTHYQPVWK